MPRITRNFVEKKFKEFCDTMNYDEGVFELDYYHGYKIVKRTDRIGYSYLPAFLSRRWNADIFIEMLEFAMRVVLADRERIRIERYDE